MKLIAMSAILALPLAAEWRLVWSDGFNGSGLPDPSRWSFEEGFVRNSEAQFYTSGRTENVRQEGGNLIIEARLDNSRKDAPITSGSIITKGKAVWRYGRVEVRAKLPAGRGTWPAIWMLASDCDEVGWPRCGEIDIMENVGYEPDVIHANIHTEAYNHVMGTNKGARVTVTKPWEDFHTYALEWTPKRLDFFLDDKKYFTYKNEGTGQAVWPFDQPFYLILNLAIGGTWGGRHGVDEAIFPQRLQVDYVRVYKQE